MKYRSKTKGCVIDVACEMRGDWEPVEAKPAGKAEKPEKATPKTKKGVTKQ